MPESKRADDRTDDDREGPVFRAAHSGVTRMAALPLTHPGAVHTLRDAAGQPQDLPQNPAQLASYLLELVEDPVVREAIEVSSASLAATLTKVEEGAPVAEAKLRRAALAATRYVLRMTGRPTPFGLLAGVRAARLGGPEPAVRTGTAHHKQARPDAGWLHQVVSRLHHDPRAREGVLVVANNLCAPRGERLVLPYVRGGTDASPESVPHEMTVGYTPVVRTAVQAARHPLTFAELRAAVREAYPDAGEHDVTRLLTGLLDREVLLADVAARQDQPDQLGYVNARLATSDSPTAAGLRRVERLLADYSASAPGEGRDAWRSAVTALHEVRAEASGTSPGTHEDRPPVHVDLRADSDIRLPDTVLDEVTAAADTLWRLGPAEGHSPHLTDYHKAFLDRYGTERLVSIRELLDPHRGLGAPAGYRVPASDRGSAPTPPAPYPAERDEALGAAVHEVLAGGPDAELVLDDGLLDRLAPPAQSPAAPPGSLDLCVQPLARSVAALATGDYRLLVSNGSYTAGAMAGRFAHVLGTEHELAALYGAEGPDEQHGDGPDGGKEAPLPVQLFFQPRSPRSNNVARTPRLLPHAVPVGCFSPGEEGDRAAGRDIGLDELAVGATADRLFLAHAPTGREVDIRRPNMLNIATEAPNLARFLAGLGMSGLRPWAPWQWSRLDVLPYLPRVRRGRTILSPARWRPTPALRDAGLDERDWLRELDRWRERYAVPDRLRVSVLDQHLDLDLTAPVHRHVLRGQLTGRGVPLVQESPLADPAQLGWSGGHATEVVVPLLPARPRPTVPRVPAGSRPSDSVGPSGSGTPLHAPGGEWLYAKLYAARDRLEPLLVRELAPLLERIDSAGDVDRWFFLRYADPGAHLRLRLHGEPAALRELVLPALHDWAETATSQGVIRKLVLDTYEPEAERYGGPEALTAAEHLFHADSRLVTAQLTARTRGQLSIPTETLAATNHALLLGALGDWDWWHWVLATYPMELQNRIPARQRRAAAGVIKPALGAPEGRSGEPEFAEPPGLASARAELTRAAYAYGRALHLGSGDPSAARGSAVASVLHMHANRLLGTDRAAEQRSYGLLRAVVRNQIGRTEHARERRE